MSDNNAVTGRKILITGGAGFIGSHLAERLAPHNDLVLFDVLRKDAAATLDALALPNTTVVEGDVLDAEGLAAACAGVDDVIHLAAIAGVETTRAKPVDTLNVNIIGTANALRGAAAAGAQRFVFFSTSEVYGVEARDVSEESAAVVGAPTEPRWGYAAAKLAGEFYTMRYAGAGILNAVVIRPFNVYGPRQVGGGAIFNMCSGALGEGAVTVLGPGTSIRAWCHVDDLVDGVVRSLGNSEASGQVFNIGNPEAVATSAELGAKVAGLVPGASLRSKPLAGPDVAVRIPNIDKASRLLGYRPRVGLDEGLRSTLEWYRRRVAS